MIARYQVVTYNGRRRVIASTRTRFEATALVWEMLKSPRYLHPAKVEPLHVIEGKAA